jgi:hypothetical protein
MTVVNIAFTVPSGTATGSLVWTPVAVSGNPSLPAPQTVALDGTGAESVTLTANDSTWVWRVDEQISGVDFKSFYVNVPNTTSVSYKALVQVDPATGKAIATVGRSDIPPTPSGVASSDAFIAARVNDRTSQTVAALATRSFINVKDYGATGNGTADDTPAFNAAITAATSHLGSGAGTSLGQIAVYVPYGFYKLTNLQVPSGIRLLCDGAMLGPTAGMTGALLTFIGSNASVENAEFAGAAIVGCSAITINSNCYRNIIKDCDFDNWDGRAVYDNGLGSNIQVRLAQNCLLGANSLSTYTGVVELNGTDAFFHQSEVTASRMPGRGMSTPKFACAVAITGANNMLVQIVAETSDHGVYIGPNATQTQMVGVRAELNYGHGFVIQGGGGEMVACHALRNSQAGSYLYDGWNASAANRFVTSALYSESGGAQPVQNHAVADSNTSASTYSIWDVISVGDNIPVFTANSGQTTVRTVPNPPLSFTGTSVKVNGRQNLIAANTAATSLTAFYNVNNGQSFRVKGDGFTTVVVGANLSTISGSNLLLAANTWYEFVGIAGVVTQTR